MVRIAYEGIIDHLEADGSLRDIYIYDTSPHDWQQVWNGLLKYDVELYNEQREKCSLPDQLTAEHLAAQYLITVITDGVQFNGYFRGGGTIEFDIQPCEIRSQRSLEVVLDFMELLAKATSKVVILTEEMGYRRRDPIIEYTPAKHSWSCRT